jgi:hypothetical protein
MSMPMHSTKALSAKAPQLLFSATILTALALIGASGPSLSAPLHPVAPLSMQGGEAAAMLVPVRAAVRGGRVAVGPRGGAVVRRGGAVAGPRGGAAVRRTAVVGPRGNVAVRNTAVVAGRGRWARPGWYRWPVGGAIAAGAAIGFATAATAAAWAGAAPAPGMCWYYTDPSRTQGFWDYCPQ